MWRWVQQRKVPIGVGAAAVAAAAVGAVVVLRRSQSEQARRHAAAARRADMTSSAAASSRSLMRPLMAQVLAAVVRDVPLPSSDNLRQSLSSSRDLKLKHWLDLLHACTFSPSLSATGSGSDTHVAVLLACLV
jgi:hypothetical protein